MRQPKDEFIQIRFAKADRERVMRAANANHLDLSAWARRAIMLAVEAWEREERTRQRAEERTDSGRPAADGPFSDSSRLG